MQSYSPAPHEQFEALRESRQMLRNVLENFPGLVFWKDRKSVFLGCNKSFAEAAGRKDSSEIIGKTDFDLPWTRLETEAYLNADQMVMKSGKPLLGIIERQLQADGRIAWFETNKVPLLDAGGNVIGVLGTSHDITERKHQEADLLQRNRQLEILARASQEINRVLDISVVMRSLVNFACELTGAKSGAAGQIVDGKMVFTEYNRAGNLVPFDYTFESGYGVPGLVLKTRQPYIANNALDDPHVIADIQKVLGFANLVDVPIFNRHGTLIGCFEIHNKADGFDEHDLMVLQGLAASAAVAFENAQMLVARQKAEEALHHAHDELEKRVQERTADLVLANKELEAFAYAVSHDLRAPLRGIDGWSQALIEDYGSELDEEATNYLQAIRDRSHHMSQLIEGLLRLSLAARGEIHRQNVNLTQLVRETMENLSSDAPDRKIQLVVASGIDVIGDPQLLQAVLQNLINNAWKFTSKSDEARIEFGKIEKEGKPVYLIRDNGAGFSMEQTPRLFTPFQRLHHASDYPGAGIGLATVQRIIHRHGGTIWAEAEIGRGATFYFTLS